MVKELISLHPQAVTPGGSTGYDCPTKPASYSSLLKGQLSPLPNTVPSMRTGDHKRYLGFFFLHSHLSLCHNLSQILHSPHPHPPASFPLPLTLSGLQHSKLLQGALLAGLPASGLFPQIYLHTCLPTTILSLCYSPA